MRTSRDVVRPLLALCVIVAAVVLVSNVAAYRAAATDTADTVDTHHVAADSRTTPQVVGSRDHDGDRDRAGYDDDNDAAGRSRTDGSGGSGSSSGGVVVVTTSGAS